jgi:hypothetical protein
MQALSSIACFILAFFFPKEVPSQGLRRQSPDWLLERFSPQSVPENRAGNTRILAEGFLLTALVVLGKQKMKKKKENRYLHALI